MQGASSFLLRTWPWGFFSDFFPTGSLMTLTLEGLGSPEPPCQSSARACKPLGGEQQGPLGALQAPGGSRTGASSTESIHVFTETNPHLSSA